jgi:hypothetical protein
VTPISFKCSKCGQKYVLGENALVAMGEGLLDDAGAFTGFTGNQVGGDNRNDPDYIRPTVWSKLPPEGRRNQEREKRRLEEVLGAGQSRWWKCLKCNTIQQYELIPAPTPTPPPAPKRAAARAKPTEAPTSKDEDFVRCWYCQTRPADPGSSVNTVVKQGSRQMTIEVPRCQQCLSVVQGTGQRIAWGLAAAAAIPIVLCLLSALILSSWWLGVVAAIVSACIAVYAAFELERRRYRTAGARMVAVFVTRFPSVALLFLGERGWTHYENLAAQLSGQASSRQVQRETE